MKTFSCLNVAALAILTATMAWADPSDRTPSAPKAAAAVTAEPKLEGDELARFYLQQILEQADNEPVESEHRDLIGELKTLVDRMAAQHQQRLERRKAIAEQRAAELQAEAERRAAEMMATPVQPDKQSVTPPCPPQTMAEPPGVCQPTMAEPGPDAEVDATPCEPASIPKANLDTDECIDRMARSQEQQPKPIVLSRQSNATPDLNTRVDVPERPEDHLRSLIVMLDRVIVGLQTVRTWLAAAYIS